MKAIILFPCKKCGKALQSGKELQEKYCKECTPEICADCGAPEDASIRFGGFDRDICLACRGLENKRIDRFFKEFGHLPTEEAPDFEKTMLSWRIESLVVS